MFNWIKNSGKSLLESLRCIFSRDKDFKTKKYLEGSKRKFLEKKKYDLAGQKFDVYVFEKKEDYFLGQYVTTTKTIIINSKIFKQTKDFQKYILLHELGHKMMPWPLKIIFWLIIGPSAIAFLMTTIVFGVSIIIAIFLVVASAIFGYWINLGFLLAAIILEIILLLLIRFAQFISEGYADCYAIKNTSKDFYLKIQPEYLKLRKANNKRRLKNMTIKKRPEYIFWKAHKWISYPTPKFAIKMYNLIQKMKALVKTK